MPPRPWLSAVLSGIVVVCTAVLCSAHADQGVLEANTKINGLTLSFDWPAVQIGAGSYEEGPTGLTIIHFKNRASVAVDVRGGAPGTVNTDGLRNGYGASFTDAIVLTGGSANGEEAITAVATGLKDLGLRAGDWYSVAFAPGAVIYDFALAFDAPIEAPVRNTAEVEWQCQEIATKRDTGLVVLPDPFSGANRELIVSAVARHRICAVYPFRYFAATGGLASYGANTLDPFGRTALYVGRILNGEKVGELPIQQATKYAFVINLKTARAPGLEVSPALLARADEGDQVIPPFPHAPAN